MSASHRSPVPETHSHPVNIAAQIATALPPHDHYIEVVAGTLEVLLAKPAVGTEVVNDTDQVLLRFWKVLRERPGELARACALSPHSRADHAAALRSKMSRGSGGVDPELEAARWVWVRCCESVATRRMRARPEWRVWVGGTNSQVAVPDAMEHYVEVMAAAAQRLHRVSLECRTPMALITQWGKRRKACLYVDLRLGQGLETTWATTALDTDAVLSALSRCAATAVVRTERATAATIPQGWSSLRIGSTDPPTGREDTVLWSNRALSDQRSLFDDDTVGSSA